MAIQMLTVAAPAAYSATPTLTLGFEPRKVTFINEDATLANAVLFSFDGQTDSGKVLGGGGVGSVYESIQRTRNIWVKRAAGTPSVTIIAES
jgi:hypothetical protein